MGEKEGRLGRRERVGREEKEGLERFGVRIESGKEGVGEKGESE